MRPVGGEDRIVKLPREPRESGAGAAWRMEGGASARQCHGAEHVVRCRRTSQEVTPLAKRHGGMAPVEMPTHSTSVPTMPCILGHATHVLQCPRQRTSVEPLAASSAIVRNEW